MEPLRLPTKFFTNQAGKVLDGRDLDGIFNDLSDYLNNILRIEVNKLQATVVSGTNLNNGAMLGSIDENTIQFTYLNNDFFDDFIIALNKLHINTPNGILFSMDGVLKNITFNERYILCVYNYLLDELPNNPPIIEFRKLDSFDYPDGFFVGDMIEILDNANLAAGLFSDLVPDNTLTGINILDHITQDKIVLNSITYKKIGSINDLPYTNVVYNQLSLDDFTSNSISSDKITDGTIHWGLFNVAAPLQPIHFAPRFLSDVNFNAYDSNNLIAGNITDAHTVGFGAKGLLANTPTNNIVNFKLTANKITLASLNKDHFTPEVQTAMAAYKERARVLQLIGVDNRILLRDLIPINFRLFRVSDGFDLRKEIVNYDGGKILDAIGVPYTREGYFNYKPIVNLEKPIICYNTNGIVILANTFGCVFWYYISYDTPKIQSGLVAATGYTPMYINRSRSPILSDTPLTCVKAGVITKNCPAIFSFVPMGLDGSMIDFNFNYIYHLSGNPNGSNASLQFQLITYDGINVKLIWVAGRSEKLGYGWQFRGAQYDIKHLEEYGYHYGYRTSLGEQERLKIWKSNV